MTDIDFDELDKAVNSLMSTTNAPKGESEAQPTDTPAPAESVAPVPEPAQAATQPEAAVQQSPTPAASPLATPAKKRSGRFMDMVHPSADMAKRTEAPASREGISVTPPSPSMVSSVNVEVPAPAVLAPEPEPTATPEPVMPDPLDMAMKETADTPAKEGVPEPVVAEEIPAPATETNETVSDDEPTATADTSESPFLPDAKVEKRPLGGDQVPTIEINDEVQGERDEKTDNTSGKQEADEPPVQPTPEELTPDIVAVEATEPKAFDKSAPEEPKKAEEKVDVPAGGSISQQYKEEPSSGDASHTAIYDASNYPNTAPKPAKKKSGWLWVLWIVVLLALGAAAAVALYMMKII